jgi:hypothetical protein
VGLNPLPLNQASKPILLNGMTVVNNTILPAGLDYARIRSNKE